jgi:hypothetical protein
MKRRLHIDVCDGITELEALTAVVEVVKLGRISNFGKQYCYHTTMVNGPTVDVRDIDKRRPSSDSFVVYKEEARG